MYAVRRNHVKKWECQPPEKRYEVLIARGGKPVTEIQPERISIVEETVMYWRKANHIHQWFVDNVQDGEDDCGNHSVTPEHMLELLDVCETVIDGSELVDEEVAEDVAQDQENPEGEAKAAPRKVIKDATTAKRLLPRAEGFFFGSQEYDEDYLDDVVRTRDWIVSTFAEQLDSETPSCLVYSSSW